MEEQLRQAQKMEGIGRLAGGVAHDFNNLLTVIQGYSGLARRKTSAERPALLEYAQLISKASDHAASLTKQLLAFSRKQIIKPRPMDLNEAISGMLPMLQRLVGEDVEVVTELAPGLGLVRADADQTSQILINLTANARDAMPEGGTLSIRTANLDAPEMPMAKRRVPDRPHGAAGGERYRRGHELGPRARTSSSRSSPPRSAAGAPAWASPRYTAS